MSNLKTPEEFIAFLKEKKVYRQFKENVEKEGKNLDALLEELEAAGTMVSAIAEGFLWNDTEQRDEGFQFWSKVADKWNYFYYHEDIGEKIPRKNIPNIISVSYSFGLSEEIIRKILSADLIEKDELLHKILEKRKEVKSVKYPHGIKKDSIEITIYTDSISNPSKNQKYWQGIANEINEHIKEEVNEIQ